MTITDIIAALKEHNVIPRVAGEDLRLTGNTGSLPASLIATVRAAKQELIAFLKQATDPWAMAAVPQIPLQESYPVSNAQKRLWVLSQFEASAVAYNIVTGFYLEGTVIKEYLEKALQLSIQKHESLRTVFKETNGIPEQVILDHLFFEMAFEDITELDDAAHYLVQEVEVIANRRFNLEKGPLIYAKLLQIAPTEFAFLLSVHHIVSDGWSMGVLLQEVMQAYAAFCRGENPVAAPLTIQYKDYAAWLLQRIAGAKGQEARAFWKEEFAATITPLNLPSTFARKEQQRFEGAVSKFYFPAALHAQMLDFCRQQPVTLFNFLRAALTVLLHKFSGQQDITIGTPVAGRHHFDLQHQLGLYVNTLPLRTVIEPTDSFQVFLQKISAHSGRAFAFQDYPLDSIVEDLAIKRDISRNPLFDIVMVLQDSAFGDGRINLQHQHGFELSLLESYCYTGSPVERNNIPAKFDLSFNFGTDPGNQFYLEIEYATALYTNKDINRFYDVFGYLAEQLLVSPDAALHTLEIMRPAERELVLSAFNDTASPFPTDQTIIDLFAKQVAAAPEAIAVIFEDRELTYRELDTRSNQLAWYLRSIGVERETLVPVCIERSIDMLVVILGILKAGAAYVPVDPSYPAARISYILSDTGAHTIISSSACRDIIAAVNSDITIITTDMSEGSAQIPTRIVLQPSQLAYVIYTSGSTGQPKGVMIEHRAVVNLIYSQTATFGITADERILQFSNYSFDAAVEQMFVALSSGAALVLFPEGLQLDSLKFENLLKEKGVTHLHTTPAFLSTVQLADMGALKRVISGGEACSVELAKRWAGQTAFYNEYGPTEVTVTATEYNCTPAHLSDISGLPIGKPLANTSAYILNPEGQPVPIGITGELYLAGPQIARGYLNAPALTAEKFVTNPFSNTWEGKMYKTGDLARWLPDGNIAYAGRIDDQVKIRGYRIEPGEIESVLQQCAGVRQAVVIATADHLDNKRLVAYIVPQGDFDKELILADLKGKLPDYMIPSMLIALDALPLTSNGKIDKKALPDTNTASLLTNEYVAPRNTTELALAMIWEELLGIVRAGIHDNFFELGGDSIIAIQVVSRAKRAGYTLRPQDIFAHQTIAALAALQASTQEIISRGEQGLLTGNSGLLPIQQRYFETASDISIPFNQSVLLTIDKNISALTLSAALTQVMRTHDALRFTYTKTADHFEQAYGTYEGVLAVDDLQAAATGKLDDSIALSAARYQYDIDITAGILLRAVLFLTPATDSENRLLLIIHHLAVDGVSWRILLDDLQLFLQEGTDPILFKGSSYRQWQQALVTYGKSDRLAVQQPYWQQVVAASRPFPADEAYTAALTTADMEYLEVSLDTQQTRSLLHDVPPVYHTVIDDLLLCALALTLTEWMNHSEVIIGVEGHGRENRGEGIDISRTVGWFTTLYPVLLQLENKADISDVLKSVKEQLRQVPDKGLGYGVLKYINKTIDPSGEEPWNIIFNYLGQLDHAVHEKSPLQLEATSFGSPVGAGFPVREKLAVNAMVKGGELLLEWSYSSKHYKKENIQALALKCLEQLQLLIAHCTAQVTPVFTPSDFGLGGEISISSLDDFLNNKGQDVEGLYRLSGLQEGLLFHALYGENGNAYMEQFSCDLYELSEVSFRKSWEILLQRHTILRSAFYYNEFSTPVQCVYREVTLPFEVLDYRDMPEAAREEAWQAFVSASGQQRFDFSTPCLMRITLVQWEQHHYRLLWNHHHILFDGWSLAVLVEELFTVYEQLTKGEILPVQDTDRYEDYIRYQENLDQDIAVGWWRNYLKEVTEGSLLPFITAAGDRNKSAVSFATESLQLNAGLFHRLTTYVQKHRITINTLIQGVWAYLLSRYTNQESVVYGVTVSGRPDDMERIEQRVGLYINTLPLYTRVEEGARIVDWLRQLQTDQLQSRERQYTPLGVIQSLHPAGNNLFDTLLVFENYPVGKMMADRSWQVRMENIHLEEHTNYPLTVSVTEEENLRIRFNYNNRLLDAVYISAMARHFEQVLQQLLVHEQGRLGDIAILTKEEHHQLSEVFNYTGLVYQAEKTITTLFEEQVARTPDSTALIFGVTTLTYQELNEKANRLGHFLRQQYHIQADDLVGIRLERGEWMIIAILGILKAGAAYVPIDPAYPQERNDYILSDSRCKVLLDDLLLETFKDAQELFGAENPVAITAPDSLMYVIYTSGSTGQPKGVLIEHQSVAALIHAQSAYFNIQPDENILQFSNYCFDAAVEQIFLALLNGARLVLFAEGLQLHTTHFEALLREREVTHLHATPGFLEHLSPGNYPALKRVIAGGDVCSRELSKRWEGLVNFYNEYGPTETTVTAIEYGVPRDHQSDSNSLPIGKPLQTVKALILDNSGNPVPVGIAGELYLGGIQVARGYLNRPELTTERFVPDISGGAGARLYKTGDLARWLPDGNITFIGRKDDQVKIRGYRIETGEIENTLLEYPDINAAVVIARANKEGEKELLAYMVSAGVLNIADLRQYLGKRLPAYMLPAHFVQLALLPLTSNGKVDKKALPEPEGIGLQTVVPYVAPRNETEQRLVSVWETILGRHPVSIKDNFFDLGGHSLKAIRLTGLIHQSFHVKIALKELFATAVLEDQAQMIAQLAKDQFISIPVAPQQAYYPLSSSQRRLWILSQFEGGAVAYNIAGIYTLDGLLDTHALSHAFEQLIERHEILRTVFKEDEQGELKQFINNTSGFQIRYQDMHNEAQASAMLKTLTAQDYSTPFLLHEGPLLRAHLYQLADDKWVFSYVMHHIISDGWSTEILIKELMELYNAHISGIAHPLTPLRIQYKDYALWQQEQLTGDTLQAHKTYWLQQFSGSLPVLDVPGDHLRPAVKTYTGSLVRRTFNSALTRNIRQLSKAQQGTLFMGLLAAVNVLLHRYTNQEDIVIGTQIAGRDHADLEEQIGVYLNTLALRARFSGTDSFLSLLSHIREVTLDAYEHQSYPFDTLIDVLELQHDASRNPLFDVSVVLHNEEGQTAKQQMGDLSISNYGPATTDISKFDLAFDFTEADDDINVLLVYNNDIYSEDTAARLLQHLEQLLEAAVSQPSLPVNQLDYLNVAERNELLFAFNDTVIPYPADKTIAALFAAQVNLTPDKTALVFEQKRYTYRELDAAADRLAAYLQTTYAPQRDEIIGIMLDRSADLLIAILGILKSGAAYVPVDASYPVARKQFILEDTGVKVLLTQSDYVFDLDYYAGHVFAMDIQLDTLPAVEPTPVDGHADDLAYVMYTSGSTGNPKGVLVSNRSVVRLVKPANFVALTGEEVLLSTGAVSFDATTFEYWGMLLNGGQLVLCSKEVLLDEERLSAEIISRGVTMMWFTAGWLNQLADTHIQLFGHLKTILAGGDKLSVQHINALKTHYPSLQIINGYGPTENTTFSLCYEIPGVSEHIPIGRPVSNSTAYILDNRGGLCGIGVVGEICVGGDGLARGYLNNPALTAEKFIDHEHGRLYKTGDIGRWLPDGTIAFAGRKDDQVKIRGYRVEPGEIERQLQLHPAVDAAVVLARANAGGEKELVAYVVSNEKLDIATLNAFLGAILPVYMLPDHYVQLDQLPLTSNGKVDRANLPDPSGFDMSAGVTYIGARDETEAKLILIWEDILGRSRIGVKDNFFDLGGHSLKATRLASQIHKDFDVKISLKDLFAHLVLEEQADLIRQARKTIFTTINTVAAQADYALSSSQRRLWVLSQFAEGNIAYNIPAVYVLEGQLDVSKLEHAFNALISRHEILRTVFKENTNGEVRQFITADSHFAIPVLDIRNEPDTTLEVLVQQEFITPFDLSTGPLLRAHIYQIADNKWVLAYVMHHIISDGWSMGILIKELLQLYNARVTSSAKQLTPLRIQYKDYAAWQQEQLSGEALVAHQAYWLQQFEGHLPVLELPVDKIRPVVKTYKGSLVSHIFDPRIEYAVQALSAAEGGTLFMGLLAAVNMLLHRYTQQEDIIIGSPIAGRQHADLEGQIGFYLNTLALRTTFSGSDSYQSLIHKVKTVTLGAYEHQLYPFDTLVDELQLQRDMSRHPLFDVMVILQNTDDQQVTGKDSLTGLDIRLYEGGQHVISKFDLLFIFTSTPAGLQLVLEYNTDIYHSDTVARLIAHLEQLLHAAIAAPATPVNQLDYLSDTEKTALIAENQVVAYPRDRTLVNFFEAQVLQTPDNIAVVCGSEQLTYRELNEQANQLAHYLRKTYDVKPDDLIGILLDRSADMIVAIIGILKSGGAYVPIDPTYPQERIDYMQRDSNCKVLINEQELLKSRQSAKDNPEPVNQPADLAYVIYTSGTTGKPKGSLITHNNVVRLFKTEAPLFDFTASDVWTMFHSYCFDFSVWEMYGALLYGGKVVIVPGITAKDPAAFVALLRSEGVTILNQTPSSFYNVIKQDTAGLQLRYVIFGGEALSPGKLADWQQQHPATQLINMYGITETTVHVTYKEITAAEITSNSSNIGRPIPTLQCYVLDQQQQLLPVGVSGELYVGGEGVCRGYLNKKELTSQRFIDNPFKAGERLYRTGDKAKLLPNGELEYAGRIDDQVKIRGFRIELGEIEHALRRNEKISDVVVIARADAKEEYSLIAYVVSREVLHTTELRAALAIHLPAYMLPAYFVQLDHLPLTANGKIDKKSLPNPADMGMATGTAYVAPRNETDEKLIAIWEELLGREGIGIKDNFFDLGGHSLKAARLKTQVKKAFNIEIDLRSIFQEPTIEVLSDKVSNDKWLQIAVAESSDDYDEIKV